MVRRVEFVAETELRVGGILGFMRRRVVRYGTGAAVICPKEFMGRAAYLVITRERWEEEGLGELKEPSASRRRTMKKL